jgi:hypothetical protein
LELIVSTKYTHWAGKFNTRGQVGLCAARSVDRLVELPRGQRWVVEVKLGSTPALARGFHEARADLQPEKRFVVYSGRELSPKAAEVKAISLTELAAELKTA